MPLYHFTSRRAFPLILETGLSRGSLPPPHERLLQAVWLTTDPGPAAHGLATGGRFMSDAERYQSREWTGTLPPPGTRLAKEASVRIAVELADGDRKLQEWLPWARRQLPPALVAELHPVGANLRSARTWRLYFGIIPASAFAAVDFVPEAARAA